MRPFIVVLAGTLTALAACSSGEPAPARAAQAPAAGKARLCDVVTKAEVEQAVGRPVTAMAPLHAAHPDLSCKIEFAPDTSLELSIGTTFKDPGIATSAALAELMKTSTFPEGLDWRPLEGLARPAAELADGPIITIQKGPARLQLTSFAIPLEATRAVARHAATRMP